MDKICVFCGSNQGFNGHHRESAQLLGQLLAQRGIALVYGGGGTGLMGAVADAALTFGGQVIGVIPRGLSSKEVAHPNLTEMHVVSTMHERKALMAELADGFIGLPGGFGTFEELFETITWAQLGIHRKPVGLLNSGRYFDPMIRMIDNAISEGFIRPVFRNLVVSADTASEILDRIVEHQLPPTPVWLSLDES